MEGPLLHAVFMSRHSGASNIYLSTVDTESDSLLSERPLFRSTSVEFNNFPRIAGTGDTLGVVWQGSERRDQNVYFTYSTKGVDALGDTVLLLSRQTDGRQANPDIAYSNGKFHMVWQDNSTSLVMYRTFDVSELSTSVEEEEDVTDLVGISQTGDQLNLDGITLVKDCFIINMEGKVQNLPVRASYDVSNYQPGIYILRIIKNDGGIQNFKFSKN